MEIKGIRGVLVGFRASAPDENHLSLNKVRGVLVGFRASAPDENHLH